MKLQELIKESIDLKIFKIQPGLEVASDKQIEMFNKFGDSVEKLVQKYQKFNSDGESIGASASGYKDSESGKIEYVEKHQQYSRTYGFNTSGWFAVKIGSLYPVDKVKEFAKEYIKLVKTELPTEVPISTKNDEIKHKKVYIHTSEVSNFNIIMVTI